MATAFDADLGVYQGRIKPTGIAAPDGEWVMCLGHDVPDTIRRVAADTPFGDNQNIARGVDFTGDTYLTQRIHIRPPATMPAGVSWVFAIGAGANTYIVPIETGGRARTRSDFSAQVAHLGASNLSYAIALIGTPGLYDVELPGIYIDSVLFDAGTDAPRVHQRSPEPGETVPANEKIFFAVSDSSLNGVATAALRVDGTLVMTATASAATFLAAGWSAVVTAVPGAFTSTYDLTPAGPWASSTIVNLDVDATIIGNATVTTTSWSFIVADVIAPVLVSAIAIDHEIVEVTFDDDVVQGDGTSDADALNPENYTLSIDSGAPAVLPNVIGAETGGSAKVVRLLMDKELTGGPAGFPAIYRVTALKLEDIAGNEIQAPLNTATFAGYACPGPEGRDIDLYKAMPELNRSEDTTGDLRKFLAVFQDPADLLFCLIDRWTRILDPDVAPEQWVDLMLIGLGNQFTFAMTLTEKRKLVKLLIEFAKRKGTGPGLVEAILFFTGITVAIHVPFWGPFGLDDPELILDQTWILSGTTQADLYTFEVRVPVIPTATQKARMIEVIEVMKVAHEHYRFVEPEPPGAPPDHWALDFSELDFETILHD